MSKNVQSWKLKLAVLAVGGSMLQLTGSQNGCRNGVIGATVQGVTNAVIVAAVDGIFGAINNESLNTYVADPLKDGLTTAADNTIAFRYPVLIVQQELFQQ